MPESEFIYSERQMNEEEYKNLSAKYALGIETWNRRVKRALIAFCVFFAAAYLLILILTTLHSGANFGNGIGDYKWLAAEFIIFALLIFDPKAESDKKFKYETNRYILLKSVRNILNTNKIRFFLTMFFGVLAAVVNFVILFAVFYEIANISAPAVA